MALKSGCGYRGRMASAMMRKVKMAKGGMVNAGHSKSFHDGTDIDHPAMGRKMIDDDDRQLKEGIGLNNAHHAPPSDYDRMYESGPENPGHNKSFSKIPHNSHAVAMSRKMTDDNKDEYCKPMGMGFSKGGEVHGKWTEPETYENRVDYVLGKNQDYTEPEYEEHLNPQGGFKDKEILGHDESADIRLHHYTGGGNVCAYGHYAHGGMCDHGHYAQGGEVSGGVVHDKDLEMPSFSEHHDDDEDDEQKYADGGGISSDAANAFNQGFNSQTIKKKMSHGGKAKFAHALMVHKMMRKGRG